MSKTKAPWIKWDGFNRPIPTSSNIDSLRAKINEALENLNSMKYSR